MAVIAALIGVAATILTAPPFLHRMYRTSWFVLDTGRAQTRLPGQFTRTMSDSHGISLS